MKYKQTKTEHSFEEAKESVRLVETSGLGRDECLC